MNSEDQKPNEPITKNGFTPEQEKVIIEESRKTLCACRSGKIKEYESAEDLIQDILNETSS